MVLRRPQVKMYLFMIRNEILYILRDRANKSSRHFTSYHMGYYKKSISLRLSLVIFDWSIMFLYWMSLISGTGKMKTNDFQRTYAHWKRAHKSEDIISHQLFLEMSNHDFYNAFWAIHVQGTRSFSEPHLKMF